MDHVKKESAARRKILDTAARLFYTNGIRATGIDAVIEQADVARMTLYNHFPSKDALVDAVLTEAACGIAEEVDAIVANQSLSAREKILTVFEWQGRRMTDVSFHGCPFVNAVAENPCPESMAHVAAVKHKEGIYTALGRCVAELGVSDPNLLVEQLTLLMDGASVRAQMGHGAVAVAAAKDAAARLIDGATCASPR